MYLLVYIYVTGGKRLVASVPGIQVCDVGESINTVSFKLAMLNNVFALFQPPYGTTGTYETANP